MQILGYHNHNFYCDGVGLPIEYIQNALNQGFKAFGFSSHAPFNFYNKWSISYQKLNNYCLEIEKIKNKYSDKISIFKSLEIDYAPNFIEDFNFFKENYNLDYTIGSIHYVVNTKTKKLLFIDGLQADFIKNLKLVFNGDIEFAVKSYFAQTAQMIITQKPDIIGHIDKIIMNSADSILINGEYPQWYLREIDNILNVVANNKVVLELNMRGLYKNRWNNSFIEKNFIPICKQKEIDFVISTDAHSPQEIGLGYEMGIKYLTENDILHTMEFKSGRWMVLNI